MAVVPLDKCMYSTRLFAEKVMPKLRDLFPEFADDNRFWCKPLARQAKVGNLPDAAKVAASMAR